MRLAVLTVMLQVGAVSVVKLPVEGTGKLMYKKMSREYQTHFSVIVYAQS